jgi:hypothetical protein
LQRDKSLKKITLSMRKGNIMENSFEPPIYRSQMRMLANQGGLAINKFT